VIVPVNRRWKGWGHTTTGRVRATNQDAFVVNNVLDLWMVADGMGGRAGGDVASQLAIETMIKHLDSDIKPNGGHPSHPEIAANLLRNAISASDLSIQTRARENPELSGMGTTLVAVHLISTDCPQIILAHVGDSRAYLLRAQTLTVLTRDHSMVEDYLSKGMISPEEALTHPQRNILTRALGIPGQAIPEITIRELNPGDVLLLCTDGLTKMLDHADILQCMLTASSPEDVSKALVEAADERGGKDNTTAVVVCQTDM
jgi:serine/threonine protein phosphatase PrpC